MDFHHTFDEWFKAQCRLHERAPFGISERHMQMIVLQICQAVEHMVDRNVVHRDMKVRERERGERVLTSALALQC